MRELLAGAAPGTPAPSERELVQRFGVARMTVRQAIDALVAEGLLAPRSRPRHVRRPAAGRGGPAARLHRGDDPSRACSPESQTLVARREKAGPGIARALELTEGDPVLHWKRLRRADGVPMCIEDAYLSEILLPGFLQSGMPTSLYAALGERGLRPTWAEDSVSAGLAAAEEAGMLEVPEGSAGAAGGPAGQGRRQDPRGLAVHLPRRPVHPLGAVRRPPLSRGDPAFAPPAPPRVRP